MRNSWRDCVMRSVIDWLISDEVHIFSKINRNIYKPPVDEDVKDIVRKNFTRELEFFDFCKQRLHKQYLALNLDQKPWYFNYIFKDIKVRYLVGRLRRQRDILISPVMLSIQKTILKLVKKSCVTSLHRYFFHCGNTCFIIFLIVAMWEKQWRHITKFLFLFEENMYTLYSSYVHC